MNKYAWRDEYGYYKKMTMAEIHGNPDVIYGSENKALANVEDDQLEARLRRCGEGIALIEKMVSSVSKCEGGKDKDIKDALKQVNADIKTMKAQLDILSNPKNKLDKTEYSLKSEYSIMNAINIVLYIYMVYNDEDWFGEDIYNFIRGGSTVYQLAHQIKEFNDGKKAFIGRRR